MSISDRLRRSSSIDEPQPLSNVNTADVGDARVVTGVVLSCEDMSPQGDIHRDYILTRSAHRMVDFFRASVANRSGRLNLTAGGAARAAFSSPVMSRRHARITFVADGSATIMDLGSMHGTYLGGVDFDGLLPEMLKPRRHYTLRTGDTILLGKPVNRDEKDWKPVAITVTLLRDTGAQPPTPPPNRYGLFFDAVGASDTEDDSYSVSSSSGEDEDGDDVSHRTKTSQAASPVVCHVPLPLNGMLSAPASRESLIAASRGTDDVGSASGAFDLNRTSTASTALRSILPPIPSIRSAIRRLPSLRELGIFSGPESCSSGENEYKVAMDEDVKVVMGDSSDTREAEAAPAPSHPEPVSISQDSVMGESMQSVTNEDEASCSMFPWQEPSHPQNQLGLEPSELNGYISELHDETRKESDVQGSDNMDSLPLRENDPALPKAAEEDDVDVKSMEISPASSRAASPAFHEDMPSDVFGPCDMPIPMEQEEQYCRCHEQTDEQPPERQEGGLSPHNGSQGEPETRAQVQSPPLPPMPVTPDNRRAMGGLATPFADDDLSQGRHAKVARMGLSYGSIPSPVSMSRRVKRSGNRLGPTLMSPTPNPPGPFGRGGRSHADKQVDPRHSPSVGALRARLRSLETRVKEVQGSALMMASMATASATASSSASAASVDEARKEMESMKEEMRRLSGLMEALMARMDKQGTTDRSGTNSQTSGKRKRSDDLCTLGVDDLECIGLAKGLDQQVRKDNIRPFDEASERPDVRPAKRMRTGDDSRKSRAVMTAAAAAGYTSLGAALTWVMLAYVL